jgi:RND family efflux transporter MFP subunit
MAPEEPQGTSGADEAAVLAELTLCENLAQTSGWAARWSAQVSGADAVLLWAPDAVNPLFLCIAAFGKGTQGFLRRSVARDTGMVQELLGNRRSRVLERSDFESTDDPWLKGLPTATDTCIAVPLEAEGMVVGLLALLFSYHPQTQATLARLNGFLHQAAPALGRALRAERKTVGMLHAIERLTNLYDLSKAFGSTLEWPELTELVARKAADFGTAEVASLWILNPDSQDVDLAATALNENYETENPPAAVGASVVGDVLADQQVLRRNRIDEAESASEESPSYRLRSLLAVPLIEDDASVGTLVLANKRGRHPEFTAEDEELIQDLGRQAVRALRNARLYLAEKKVEELDALLVVSREITATLDLDKVMQTLVNATAALITYDRCAIAILDRGKLRLGAVSGAAELDRKSAENRRTEELLQWVFWSGSDTNVTLQNDGTLMADRPETEEKFRAFFQESGLKSFYATILKDEEGKLGVLGFESREPLLFDEETRGLLQILVNQATVAVRNAQLYQQVPLAGFWKPLLEKRRKLLAIPRRRRLSWALGMALGLALLIVVPWPLRVAGPARVLPGRRAAVTSLVDGVIGSVSRREGDIVGAGDTIATLQSNRYEADVAAARTALEIAESDVSRAAQEGDAGAVADAKARQREARARLALEQERMGWTTLRSPVEGVIATARIDERVGQFLPRGAEFCVVADLTTITAEIAVPESEALLVRPGQKTVLKFNAYPGRTFQGAVRRVAPRVREEGPDRFLIAEAAIPNPGGLIKTGMLGRGKISAGTRPLVVVLFRKPVRYLWTKLWPLLP